ncbi:MAG TPA: TIM barrel protein [Bryobacteraceae bacterium]|nr:TIM barrel protein [Bryobacteraceae bacterium]
MRRRDFLLASAAVAGAGRIWGQPGSDKAKLARMGSMTQNVQTLVKDPDHPDDPKRTLDLLDLPQLYKERLGVHYIEPTCAHFASTEKDYLNEFKARVRKAGLEINQISLGALAQQRGQDMPIMTISSPERTNRIAAIDLTKQWIDHAAYLGCPRVMLHQGHLAPEVRKETIAALQAMTDYGKSKNVKVTLELRQSDWHVIVELLKATGCWMNCHSQNPPEALRVMFPMTSGSMHLVYGMGGRGRRGGSRGNQPPRDPDVVLHEQMQVIKAAHYNGIFSIEHGGPDPFAAVQTVVKALLREM